MTKLICFEGGEKVGKTTAIQGLKTALEDKGFRVMATREPGGCALGEDIREILLDKNYGSSMDNIVEALLFAGARRAHVIEKLGPALFNGEYDYIIMDRFIFSSLVYQGEFYDNTEMVYEINRIACTYEGSVLIPDITIILDVNPEIAFSRHRGEDQNNRLDGMDLSMAHKIRDGYFKVASKKDYGSIYKSVIVNADDTPDNVLSDIMGVVLQI